MARLRVATWRVPALLNAFTSMKNHHRGSTDWIKQISEHRLRTRT